MKPLTRLSYVSLMFAVLACGGCEGNKSPSNPGKIDIRTGEAATEMTASSEPGTTKEQASEATAEKAAVTPSAGGAPERAVKCGGKEVALRWRHGRFGTLWEQLLVCGESGPRAALRYLGETESLAERDLSTEQWQKIWQVIEQSNWRTLSIQCTPDLEGWEWGLSVKDHETEWSFDCPGTLSEDLPAPVARLDSAVRVWSDDEIDQIDEAASTR